MLFFFFFCMETLTKINNCSVFCSTAYQILFSLFVFHVMLHILMSYLPLFKGANLVAEDQKGRQPAHLAAMRNHVKILCLLFDMGVDLDCCCEVGKTPLHYAAQYGGKNGLSLPRFDITQISKELTKAESCTSVSLKSLWNCFWWMTLCMVSVFCLFVCLFVGFFSILSQFLLFEGGG